MTEKPVIPIVPVPAAVTTPSAPPPPPATSNIALIRTLGLVSTICGLVIVGAYQLTFDAVAANKRQALERAIFKVIPAAKTVVEYVALADGTVKPRDAAAAAAESAAGVGFYATFDADGQLAGIAAEGGAKGYADMVRIMYGYSPACQCVVGIGVVSMRETPGIGDKIITDPAFLKNFVALDVKLNAELKALANDVKTVKHGTKTDAWQVDAIAGATITSRAVGKAINDSAQQLLPRLAPHLDQLRKS